MIGVSVRIPYTLNLKKGRRVIGLQAYTPINL